MVVVDLLNNACDTDSLLPSTSSYLAAHLQGIILRYSHLKQSEMDANKGQSYTALVSSNGKLS